MERLEKRILEVLKQHPGKAQAVTVSELQRLFGVSSRKIRAVIAALVTSHRAPIASTVRPPYGFYLVTNAEEARECLRQYWSRAREVSRRAKILNEVVKERFGIDVQQEFEFGEPDARSSPA